MSKKIYDMITNQIIEKLEQGTVPWEMPFKRGIAVNYVTQKPYRGINTWLLDGGEYATFKQITDNGGKVKKGAKSQIVVFWKMLDVEDEETGEEAKIPLLRYYRVFKIGEQTEGIEPKRKDNEVFEHDPIESAENIIKNYINCPQLSGAIFIGTGFLHFRKKVCRYYEIKVCDNEELRKISWRKGRHKKCPGRWQSLQGVCYNKKTL